MKQDTLTNAILVLRCQKHDELAFKELVSRWESHLYYYVRRVIERDNAVWDILQETWLAVFQNIHKLEDPWKFPIWLYRISHNKAINLLREENKYVQITDEEISDYCENNFLDYSKQQAENVHELLSKLKLAHREVLTLYYLEGFSIKEMADILEVSEGTVKSRLHYAKKRITEMSKGANDV